MLCKTLESWSQGQLILQADLLLHKSPQANVTAGGQKDADGQCHIHPCLTMASLMCCRWCDKGCSQEAYLSDTLIVCCIHGAISFVGCSLDL